MTNFEEVRLLKNQYPEGCRIKLIRMNDDTPLPSGTIGTVTHVDDIGTIHVNWDNGSTLGLVPDEDYFVKIS